MIIPQNQGFLDTAEEEAYVQLERRVVSIHRRAEKGNSPKPAFLRPHTYAVPGRRKRA
jgi:hypothetical protein